MKPSAEPTPWAPGALLRTIAAERATLRDLLAAVAGDLERLACERPELVERFQTSVAAERAAGG